MTIRTRDADTTKRKRSGGPTTAPTPTTERNRDRRDDRHEPTNPIGVPRSKAASGADADPDDRSHPLLRARWNYGNRTIQQLLSRGIQPKLLVGPPNDRYEREADRIAEAVMRAPEPTAVETTRLRTDGRGRRAQRLCADCRRRLRRGAPLDCPRCEERLQRAAVGGATPVLADDAEREIESARGGRRLSPSVRRALEQGFGTDFSRIRIHDGPRAARIAADLNARAFTSGADVFFGAGQYRPETNRGRRLLAHELVHSLQQGAVPEPAGIVSPPDPAPTADGPDETGGDGIETAPTAAVETDTETDDPSAGREPLDVDRSSRSARSSTLEVGNTDRSGGYDAASSWYPRTDTERRFAVASRTPGPADVIQREALYTTIDAEEHLLLLIPFGDELIFYDLTLDPDLVPYFEADETLADAIGDRLEQVFNPDGVTLHETAAFLRGPGVQQLMVHGLRAIVRSGFYDFSELAAFLGHRTELFYSQRLVPDATRFLADSLGIEPAAIDWTALLPELRELATEFEPVSLLDASLRDRYAMFLEILATEAAELPAVVGPASVPASRAEFFLMGYVSSYGSTLFTEDVFSYHSEKFLEEYVGLIETVRYVPAEFDVEAFRPDRDTTELDRRREALVTEFVRTEAHGRVVRYILDRWTESAQAPEEFLSGLNVADFRRDLIARLADELVDRARADPTIRGALRSRALDQARFAQVAWLYQYGRALEARNASLYQAFATVPIEDLSTEHLAIAADPYVYYDVSTAVAGFLRDLLSRLSPNEPIELDVLRAGLGLVEAQDMPPAFAGIFLLSELLSYLQALKDLLEEQERKTRESLEEQLDLHFDEIATVVRAAIEHAERFIREEWIPMLKRIAEERAAENLAELRYMDEHWAEIRSARTIQFAQGAAELDHLADELETGRVEQVEFEGRTIGPEGVEQLRDAAAVLRAAGIQQLDDEKQDEQREKIREVIEDYERIVENIRDGTYDPLDYSRAVYMEARERLGIAQEFPEFTTVGMVLRRQMTARENPFLEYAIVSWRFKEGLERDFERAMVLVGLGVLSVAAALVPGALGVVLGAIDIGLGLYLSAQQVLDAQAMLQLARLDVHGDIVGVSEEAAEAALKNAWIGLAVTVIVTGGVTALQARATLLQRGGARVPRERGRVSLTNAETTVLGRTEGLHGSRLNPSELAAEANVASRARSRPSRMPGYDEEVPLPNGHVWRRQGETWCRFSIRPFCMPAASLPRNLRRRAYESAAKTLDEGLDPSGRIDPNRGHSHARHGAQTTPEQHRRRLTEGIAPDNVNTGIPPNGRSSKFATHRAHLDAYQRALDELGANYLTTSGRPKLEFTGHFDIPGVGKSYTLAPDPLRTLPRMVLHEETVNRVFFAFRRNAHGWYDLITMYPVP